MPRAYRKTKRAARAAETRQRIVDAAVGLHMSIGPARTTVSAIAERAGVDEIYRQVSLPNERRAVPLKQLSPESDVPDPLKRWLDRTRRT